MGGDAGKDQRRRILSIHRRRWSSAACRRCADATRRTHRLCTRGRLGACKGVILPGFGSKAPHWSKIHAYLKGKGVKPISPLDCWRRAESGRLTLLDVRFKLDYDQWSIEPSVSVPYVYTTILRRIWGLSLWEFGIPIGLRGGLKGRDEQFVAKVEALLPNKRQPIAILDIAGGSLEEEPLPEFSRGMNIDRTRSQALQCAYELTQAGYSNLFYVRGGCNDWHEMAANELEGKLPQGGPGNWLGHDEVYAYRQYRFKDATKGRRTF